MPRDVHSSSRSAARDSDAFLKRIESDAKSLRSKTDSKLSSLFLSVLNLKGLREKYRMYVTKYEYT